MKRARGQAVSEFALIMPVFMLAVMAFLYLGLYVFQHMVVLSAAIHGARVGIEVCSTGSADDAEQEIARAAGFYSPGAQVTATCDQSTVAVTVSRTMTMRIPYLFERRVIEHQMEYPLVVKN
jgi:Flp pilus assembly protein TadG